MSGIIAIILIIMAYKFITSPLVMSLLIIGAFLLVLKIIAKICKRIAYKKHRREEAPKNARVIEIKVAGVSFNNKDGTNRQQLLECLRYGRYPFEEKRGLYYQIYTYKKELAVAVMCNGYMLGNIPRSDLPTLLPSFERGTYSTTVYEFVGGGEKNIGMRIFMQYW